ncbi:ferrochelatase 2 [Bacillus sp. J14TS2]|uniref:ferrochelatase n=1 Tax=Bacillus sp. J14TS2 TaxID=2807188 RepID=UPI001B15F396|nr:ferrochelatase [Bacillus sp. J14TS2]GIN71876.1 ferrochelatase 2 [Bacillus sp. J14TS2]
MIGLITFAYGAPTSLDDLSSYYAHIHGGKPLSAEKLEEMKNQFRRWGVADTLGSITKRQIKALASVIQPHFSEPVQGYTAYKHTSPFVEETVTQMIADGVTKIITIPFKPVHTKSGNIYYQTLVRNALRKLKVDIPVNHIEQWHHHPSFIKIFRDRVKTAWDWLPHSIQNNSLVIFTAHSLAGKAETRQAFEKQLLELANSIVDPLSLPKWRIAYRSAGSHEGLWSEPDIQEVIKEEANRGCQGIIVCELLTVTENIEALFDIGYNVQDLCRELDIEVFRTPMHNDSFDFIKTLEEIVIEQIDV